MALLSFFLLCIFILKACLVLHATDKECFYRFSNDSNSINIQYSGEKQFRDSPTFIKEMKIEFRAERVHSVDGWANAFTRNIEIMHKINFNFIFSFHFLLFSLNAWTVLIFQQYLRCIHFGFHPGKKRDGKTLFVIYMQFDQWGGNLKPEYTMCLHSNLLWRGLRWGKWKRMRTKNIKKWYAYVRQNKEKNYEQNVTNKWVILDLTLKHTAYCIQYCRFCRQERKYSYVVSLFFFFFSFGLKCVAKRVQQNAITASMFNVHDKNQNCTKHTQMNNFDVE